MANIRFVNETGADGEFEQAKYDKDGNRTVVETRETNHSRIKKKTLLTLEDIRALLLELFPK